MKFKEVLPLLREGHAVRRTTWKPVSNIRLEDEAFIWETGNPVKNHHAIVAGLFTSDWEPAA